MIQKRFLCVHLEKFQFRRILTYILTPLNWSRFPYTSFFQCTKQKSFWCFKSYGKLLRYLFDVWQEKGSGYVRQVRSFESLAGIILIAKRGSIFRIISRRLRSCKKCLIFTETTLIFSQTHQKVFCLSCFQSFLCSMKKKTRVNSRDLK